MGSWLRVLFQLNLRWFSFAAGKHKREAKSNALAPVLFQTADSCNKNELAPNNLLHARFRSFFAFTISPQFRILQQGWSVDLILAVWKATGLPTCMVCEEVSSNVFYSLQSSTMQPYLKPWQSTTNTLVWSLSCELTNQTGSCLYTKKGKKWEG